MKITQASVRRPVTTLMFFLAVILLGFVSLRELSVDLLPDISYPRLSVVTRYQGVAPEEIETRITRPLEAAASTIPGLRRVESVSREGFSYMTLEFSWGTDMDFAMLHTREKLDNARYGLPEGAENPTIVTHDPHSRPIMILVVSGAGSLLELKEFSEEVVKPRLEQIEGIGSAEIAGGVEREIQVEVDPDLLSLYGLTLSEISQRLENFNRNLEGGYIKKGRFKYALRVVGEFERIKEIGEIKLKTTQQRGSVRLKDIAAIKDSIKEREGVTRLNAEESVGLLVRKESGANTVNVTRLTHEVLDEIKKEYPQTDILVVTEQADYIESAISSVLNSIVIGGILAFFVLFIFLQDVKTPLIIAVVIPISIIATFNLLYFRNITLNIMSLGGLALGVGMLVDNSIVVSESIFRHRKEGKGPIESAVLGTKEVGMAVTASTLTTISVFLPVIYVHGVAGQLFKDQSLTVTFALLSSLIVSLTLLPMLYSRSLKLDKAGALKTKKLFPGKVRFRGRPKLSYLWLPFEVILWFVKFVLKSLFWGLNIFISFILQLLFLVFHTISLPFKIVFRTIFRGYNHLYEGFAEHYHRFLAWSLDHKGKVFAAALGLFAVTLVVAFQLPSELMPKPESTSFILNEKTPIEYSFDQTEQLVFETEKWLKNQPSVETVYSQVGVVSGMEGMDPDVTPNTIKIHISAKRKKDLDPLISSLRKKLDGYSDLVYSIVKEQSTLTEFLAMSTAEIGLKILGDDLDTLKGLARMLAEEISTIEGVTDVNALIEEGKPEYVIKIKKKAMEKYNLSPYTVGDFLVTAVRGDVATQFKELEKKYDIRVRFEENARQDIESVLDEMMPLQNSLIPLRELVDYEISRGPKEIRRENQQREVIVSANLRGRKISQVVPLIQEKIDNLDLSLGYRVEFSGEQEEMQKSFRSLIFAFCLAALLVYMIMAAQFESLLHPFIILFTLPMGLIGAVWALFITGQTLNVISIIGMVVLAGIVVNDAIVKIDYTNQLRKKGAALRGAILEASRVRLRPILMTTVTTALGLFPMSLGIGKGSELQQPLAIAVIGGLLLATFLTLILIPLTYELFDRKKRP
ncbi:MAG: efflux RND transporter permease subunit [Candidatus Aminicenantes bacterium]|nr:efflux RND transporter permease subunit [Candidatus Aminicenantes bacterium]